MIEFAGTEGGTVWLVSISEAPGIRCRWTLDGSELYYSDAHGAWCALTTDTDGVQSRISRLRRNGRQELLYCGDINGSGLTDINDAQMLYSIGNGQQSFETKNAKVWLVADLNGDGKITAADASELLRLI